MRSLMKKGVAYLGWGLQAIAALCLLGWLQAGDPDCEYSTNLFAQLRMCDPAIVGEPQAQSWLRFALIIGLFVVGLLCVRWTRKSK